MRSLLLFFIVITIAVQMVFGSCPEGAEEICKTKCCKNHKIVLVLACTPTGAPYCHCFDGLEGYPRTGVTLKNEVQVLCNP